jgi:Family of unknown function (DUF6544)
MKVLLLSLIVIHALVHLFGHVRAIGQAKSSRITRPLSRVAGAMWVVAAVLFMTSFIMLLYGDGNWWVPAVPGVILSEVMIIRDWPDMKFGTLLNMIMIVPLLASFSNSLPSSYRNRYETEVKRCLVPDSETVLLSEQDLDHLPSAVRRYVQYSGAIGKPRATNVRVCLSGMFRREKEDSWMPVSSRQYDFFREPARIFYIESSVFGVPFDGLHVYKCSSASMQIKLAHIFHVADANGEKMTKGETVTLFNDMCVLAPSTLVDTTIRWTEIDSLTVGAQFTNKGITISAVLSFNRKGELVNFSSNDRYLSEDGESYTRLPWSTPLSNYKDFGGRKIASCAEAIWHTPGGDFSYAKFVLSSLEYNCTEYR